MNGWTLHGNSNDSCFKMGHEARVDTAHIRKQLGISDSLLRLSVGVEDLLDLKGDIEQALR